ncbi:MAG: nucleotidyltransferase family protein [Minisyncoccia bacterium]
MDKDEVKQKILRAIENEPMRGSIKKASLFGSFLHGSQTQDSDIDVLIEFKPETEIGFFEFARIQRRLGEFMGRKIDLLTYDSLSKFFRGKVIGESEVIYEG